MRTSIEISDHSRTPKYIQLAKHLTTKIENKLIAVDEQLPSINYLSAEYDISRDTARKAYIELKRRNLVEGVRGKGYYVKVAPQCVDRKIFFLTNKLSAHKKTLYDALREELGASTKIDFFIYNSDIDQFEQLIMNNLTGYTHYVIIPHFYKEDRRAADIIRYIPKDKLIMLDRKMMQLGDNYGSVYQDFEHNLYSALTEAKSHLRKYSTLKLIFPLKAYQPREIISGFQNFCIANQMQGKLVVDVEKDQFQPGDVFISMMEDELVSIIKKSRTLGLKVGQDIGIISYNENPLKEVLLDGITVISTDFEQMGRDAASMIRTGERMHLSNPFRLILRNSL